jgi:uncharacterized protein related to proFAR isomerase
MNKIHNIAEAQVIQDIESIYNDVLIIENDDMVVVSTQKMASRYYNQAKPPEQRYTWIVKELHKNSSDDVVMIKVIYVGTKKPTWVPYSDEELLTQV